MRDVLVSRCFYHFINFSVIVIRKIFKYLQIYIISSVFEQWSFSSFVNFFIAVYGPVYPILQRYWFPSYINHGNFFYSFVHIAEIVIFHLFFLLKIFRIFFLDVILYIKIMFLCRPHSYIIIPLIYFLFRRILVLL